MSESAIADTSTAPTRLPGLTVWFMAASTGVIIASMYYIQPLLAEVARTFHLSVIKIGFVAMLAQVGTSLGMLLFVPLGDTKERRSLITVLLVVATIALTLIAMSQNAVWLAIACFVLGMTGSSVHIFVPFAAHLAPPEQRGRVVGSVFSGILMGILLARTFSGSIGAHLGWRAVYAIAAVLMLCVAILVQFLLPHSKPTLKLSYVSLLKSTVELVRTNPALRESAFFGATFFSCFAAFWTTLVFFLETAAVSLRQRSRRAVWSGRRRRRGGRPARRPFHGQARAARSHRRFAGIGAGRIRRDVGGRDHARGPHHRGVVDGPGRASRPRGESNADLRPGAGCQKPPEHVLYGLLFRRRSRRDIPRRVRVAVTRLARRLRVLSGGHVRRARGIWRHAPTRRGTGKLNAEDGFQRDQHQHPQKHQHCHAHARLAVHFGNQVRGGHVQRHARPKTASASATVLRSTNIRPMPASVAAPRIADEMNATRRLCPLASISDATVNPSGILCRKIATKITPAEPRGNEQARCNRHAVEKRVDHQAQQRGVTRMRVRNFFVMRLLAEMKMRRHRVLEKMHQQISRENEHEDRAGVAEK